MQKSIMEKDEEMMEKCFAKQGIKLKEEEKLLEGKDLIRVVFEQWINCAETVLDMCCTYLPSPIEAQKTRISKIFNSYENLIDEAEDGEGEEDKVDLEDYELV
jgi:elongation factor 2